MTTVARTGKARSARGHGRVGEADEATLRWGVYVRISKDPTKKHDKVERQEQDCLDYIQRHGGLHVGTYDDNDRSAYKGKRAAFEALCEDIASGKINAVVTFKIDRYARDNMSSAVFADLLRRKRCKVHTVDGERDLKTGTGKFMWAMEAAVAQKYSDDLSEKIIRAMEDRRQRGKSTGGGRFYGWVGTYCGIGDCIKMHMPMTIVEEEAEIIRECTDRVLAGESINAITKDLNEREIPRGKGGAKWDRKTIKNVVCRARNAGLIERRDPETGVMTVVPGVVAKDWDAIVSERDWRAAKAILTDSARSQHWTDNKVKHLLSVIAICAECGHFMIAGKASGSHTLKDGSKVHTAPAKVYKCGGPQAGTHPQRRQDPINLYVEEWVIATIERSSPEELLRVHLDDEQAQVEADLLALDERMKTMSRQHAKGSVPDVSFWSFMEEATAERERLLQVSIPITQEQVLRDFLGAESVRAVWDSLGIDRKRAVIRTLTDGIIVKRQRRGTNFDPSSVVIVERYVPDGE